MHITTLQEHQVSSSTSEFVLKSTRVVTPRGITPAAIRVVGDRIADILPFDISIPGVPVEDLGGLVVMPGLVDTHVHINEPGRTEWEGFASATAAAAAGGLTMLVDMPLNSTPVTTSLGAFEEKLAASHGKLRVDCGFHAGLVPGNEDDLPAMIDAGVLGVKAFLVQSGIDDFPNVRESDLRRAMSLIADAGIPLLVHAELISPGFVPVLPPGSNRSYQRYLASRPDEWECGAISMLIELCREFRCPVHIVHLSSALALPMLEAARAEGLPLTVETCPHYLCFSADEIGDGDTRFKCAPPIRSAENREQLWEGLRRRNIDFIVSDHSPSTPDLKHLDDGDFTRAWGGIASLQFGLSAVWTAMRARGMGFEKIIEWMSARPAEFAGLRGRKGAITPGCDADLVVWDPEETFRVEPAVIHHRHKVTPYEGRILSGVVYRTYLRGMLVYKNGEFVGSPAGRCVFKGKTVQA